jgi:hypothetical protein
LWVGETAHEVLPQFVPTYVIVATPIDDDDAKL